MGVKKEDQSSGRKGPADDVHDDRPQKNLTETIMNAAADIRQTEIYSKAAARAGRSSHSMETEADIDARLAVKQTGALPLQKYKAITALKQPQASAAKTIEKIVNETTAPHSFSILASNSRAEPGIKIRGVVSGL